MCILARMEIKKLRAGCVFCVKNEGFCVTVHAETFRIPGLLGAVSLTYLSSLKEGFTPIFSATQSYGKRVSP